MQKAREEALRRDVTEREDQLLRVAAEREEKLLRVAVEHEEERLRQAAEHDLLRVRLGEVEARLAERDRDLLRSTSSASAAARDAERLREDLWAIYSSKSWRMLVRYWKLRAAVRFSRPAAAPRPQTRPPGASRRDPRLAGGARGLSAAAAAAAAVLAWLSVPNDTPPAVAVARLRGLVAIRN